MSKCRYCRKPVIWIAKPAGHGWFPPFDMPDGLKSMRYVMQWGPTGEWVAMPEDQSIEIPMTQHECEEYDTYMNKSALITAQAIHLSDMEEFGITPTVQEVEVVREVYIKPTHEEYAKVARKLSHACPTCGAVKYQWCFYIGGHRKGEETERLHKER